MFTATLFDVLLRDGLGLFCCVVVLVKSLLMYRQASREKNPKRNLALIMFIVFAAVGVLLVYFTVLDLKLLH